MEEIDDFVSCVPSLQELQSYELVEYFIYFLTVINGKPCVKTPEIEECFRKAHLPAYPHISQYLSRKSSNKAGQTPIFIRDTEGYCLTRFKKDELDKKISAEPAKRETSKALSELLDNLVVGSERDFLKEAIDCYEIGAYRAAIIMEWILSLDHLYEYILAHKLADFNAELTKIKDKRIKVNVIASKDDFCDIPESKFIEKAVDFILLGLASGANLSKLFNDTARNLMKSKQLLEERNSSLALQKYSLILIALFLMPLILGMISSIISSFDISMLSLFDENISLSEKKDSMFVIKQAILIYLIEFSFITAFFISLIENNKSKLPIYGILFAVSSLAIFSWFG